MIVLLSVLISYATERHDFVQVIRYLRFQIVFFFLVQAIDFLRFIAQFWIDNKV